jgi:MFS family permease
VGRKPLLLIAAAGMGVSQVLLAVALQARSLPGSVILAVILLYIAFFAMAMGPIVWVIMSEIFPTRLRGSAMAAATVVLWAADFAVTLTFPVISDRLNESTAFWIYAAMCVIDFVFILAVLPETKGKTLEEIETRWLNRG